MIAAQVEDCESNNALDTIAATVLAKYWKSW